MLLSKENKYKNIIAILLGIQCFLSVALSQDDYDIALQPKGGAKERVKSQDEFLVLTLQREEDTDPFQLTSLEDKYFIATGPENKTGERLIHEFNRNKIKDFVKVENEGYTKKTSTFIKKIDIELKKIGSRPGYAFYEFDENCKINGKPGSCDYGSRKGGGFKIFNIEIFEEDSQFKADRKRICECFIDGCTGGKYKKQHTIAVNNKTEEDLKFQIKAICGNIKRGGTEYEFDFYETLDRGVNNIYEISQRDVEKIELHSSNWQELQFRVKYKRKWSQYQKFENNKKINIDNKLIKELYGSECNDLTLSGSWQKDDIKQVSYILYGKAMSPEIDAGKSNIAICGDIKDIRNLMIDNKLAKIKDNMIYPIDQADKPDLVIIDLNRYGPSNEKEEPGFRKKIKTIFEDDLDKHIYKFLTCLPENPADFDILGIKSFNTKIDQFPNVNSDKIEDFWKYLNKKGENATDRWIKKNVWIFEPILDVDKLRINETSDDERASRSKPYLRRITELGAIEDTNMYGDIYYLTLNEPKPKVWFAKKDGELVKVEPGDDIIRMSLDEYIKEKIENK